MLFVLSIFFVHRPITGYSYFLLPATYTRSTCTSRKESIKFIKWFYNSVVVAKLAEQQGMSVLPAIIKESIDVENFLDRMVTCDGDSLAVADAQKARLAGTSILGVLANLYADFFDALDETYVYSYVTESSNQAMTQLLMHEVDASVIAPDVVKSSTDANLIQQAIDSGEVFILPAYIAGVVPIVTMPTVIVDLYSVEDNLLWLPSKLFPLQVIEIKFVTSFFTAQNFINRICWAHFLFFLFFFFVV
jgi:hypothetical protein